VRPAPRHACGVRESPAATDGNAPGSVTVHAQISDETFLAVDRPSVAAIVAQSGRWATWWPDLRPDLTRDRGPQGCQWVLTGRIGGTAEIYLEPWHDGTLVHLFLRLDLPGPARPGRLERALRRRALAWKATITRLKDELEAGRAPGTPARAAHVAPGT
jgi:hypothetical protein